MTEQTAAYTLDRRGEELDGIEATNHAEQGRQTEEYVARLNHRRAPLPPSDADTQDIPSGERPCPTSDEVQAPSPVGRGVPPLEWAEDALRLIREYDAKLTEAVRELSEVGAKLWRERERNRDLTAGLQQLYDEVCASYHDYETSQRALDLAERLLGLKPGVVPT